MILPGLQQLYCNTLLHFTNNEPLVQRCWQLLYKSYSRRNRYYHNLHHIEALLQSLQPLQPQMTDYMTVLLAVFYHDAVYNTLRQDNEARSAALAAKHLTQLQLPRPVIDACCDYIMATKHHEPHAHNDCNLFTDADLAILGTEPAQYRQYAAAIRKEYKWYPDMVYNKGRKQVLTHLLQKEQLYKTAIFFTQYEAAARRNMQEEMTMY